MNKKLYELGKEMLMATGLISCNKTNWYNGTVRVTSNSSGLMRANINFSFSHPEIDRIIFNPPTTIVYWKDGTKTLVRAHNEAFIPEVGVAQALVRKVYPNRTDFLRKIEEAQWQEKVQTTKKKQKGKKSKK